MNIIKYYVFSVLALRGHHAVSMNRFDECAACVSNAPNVFVDQLNHNLSNANLQFCSSTFCNQRPSEFDTDATWCFAV